MHVVSRPKTSSAASLSNSQALKLPARPVFLVEPTIDTIIEWATAKGKQVWVDSYPGPLLLIVRAACREGATEQQQQKLFFEKIDQLEKKEAARQSARGGRKSVSPFAFHPGERIAAPKRHMSSIKK